MTRNLFPDHTDWTEGACHYVAAFHRTRMALIAGPYRTAAEAERAMTAAQEWAVRSGGDPAAADYEYAVHQAWSGHARSILGEWEPPPAGGPTPFDGYAIEPFRAGGPDSPSAAGAWVLVGHVPGEGTEVVGYFPSREQAAEVYSRITGRPYGG
jgi:hypothetical protein